MRSKRKRRPFDPNHKPQLQHHASGLSIDNRYNGVGLILGVARHSFGSVKAETRWGWSVTKEARKPE